MVLGKEKSVKGLVIAFWVLVAGAVLVELRDGALLWPVLLLFAWVVYWFSSNRGSQTKRVAEIPNTHQPEVEPVMSATQPFPDEESDSLVSVTLPGGEQSSGFRIKGGGGISRAPVRWIVPGESLEIGNITITGGFFYEGTTGRGSPESIDGCVVDPRAEVSRHWGGATSAPPSFRLSYQNLTAEQRRIYLEWLSSAREKSDINENYYRLYLYGFERRILIDAAVGKVSKEELRELVRELRRIVSFSDEYSWQLHVRGLCDYAGLLDSLPGRVYEQQAPEISGATYQVPLNVRVAFGQAAVDKKPVPAPWALAWAESDSMISRRTPVLRCPDEFRKAFRRKYAKRFGDGMMRIQPVDATHLRLHSSKECCHETETADLLYRYPEGVNVGALA
ncbi:hypothetical protein DID96_36580, partial [Burkholderia sp. Bp8963]|uniref:TerB N-terminal domain-containing protein n=1 Tax=Burkholderia sp. Bp8963 TaxID=2184547 RepID=UPI000F92289A